jgi:hypothetical protein
MTSKPTSTKKITDGQQPVLTERHNFWRLFGVPLPNPGDYDVALSKLKKFIQDAELLTVYLFRRTDHDCSLGHPDLR